MALPVDEFDFTTGSSSCYDAAQKVAQIAIEELAAGVIDGRGFHYDPEAKQMPFLLFDFSLFSPGVNGAFLVVRTPNRSPLLKAVICLHESSATACWQHARDVFRNEPGTIYKAPCRRPGSTFWAAIHYPMLAEIPSLMGKIRVLQMVSELTVTLIMVRLGLKSRRKRPFVLPPIWLS